MRKRLYTITYTATAQIVARSYEEAQERLPDDVEITDYDESDYDPAGGDSIED